MTKKQTKPGVAKLQSTVYSQLNNRFLIITSQLLQTLSDQKRFLALNIGRTTKQDKSSSLITVRDGTIQPARLQSNF